MMIAMLRANHVSPDPRVEKELQSLSNQGVDLLVLGWDRMRELDSFEKRQMGNSSVVIRRARLRGEYAGGLKNILGLLAFQFFLAYQLWRHRTQLAAIHAADFNTALVGLLMARLIGVPMVYDIYDYFVDAFPVPRLIKPLIARLDIAVINRADAVIIVSEARSQQISKSRPRRLVVVHNSPMSSVEQADDRCVRDRCFAYFGVLIEGRMLPEILEVFARRPDLQLYIGGFGSLSGLVERYSRQFSNIHFFGRTPYHEVMHTQSEVVGLFAVYDPTVPNHRFSAPNKFYEALSLGKPIVVARGTGIDQLVEEHEVGLVVDYDAASFEAALDELLGDPERCKAMGLRGRRVFAQNFSWSIMADRLLGIYQELHVLDSRRPRI